MNEQKKYVFTGGPCTGKTTLLNALSGNYQVLPEAARQIIEEEQTKTNGTLPWTDFDGFEKLVYERQITQENSVRNYQGTVLLDRGTSDITGYYKANNLKTPSWLEKSLKETRYNAVFILDRLPESYFKNDSARKETPEEAAHIHNSIIAAYKQAGYEPIMVPWGVDRKHFVEQKMSELESKLEEEAA